MGLFGRKKNKEEEVDVRTDLERKFEDVGQNAGKKTGEFVQKSIDKIEEVKVKVKADEKMEKVKDKIDVIVGKATKASKDTYVKVKEKARK